MWIEQNKNFVQSSGGQTAQIQQNAFFAAFQAPQIPSCL
jgi:hypothetical protein